MPRMSTLSVRDPKYPAIAPMTPPMMMAKPTVRNPMRRLTCDP